MADMEDQTMPTSSSNSDQVSCPSLSSSTSSTPKIESTTKNDIDEKSKLDKELLVQAIASMQHGKRHMIVSDYASAVPCFEIACELLGQIYGLRAFECAEAYLNYGISLYEMSRLEEGLDGGIVNVGNPQESCDEDEDEEEDEENMDDENANDENEEEGSQNQDNVNDVENDDETNKEEDISSINNDAKESNNELASSTTSDVNIEKLMSQQSTSKDSGELSSNLESNNNENDDNDDNATNIEIAFEVLTTAKEIYKENLSEKESKLNYAEALQKLAEISIDWENPDGAIELLNECYRYRMESLPSDDRLIAVTFHYLGLAYSFKHDCDNSNKCFQRALDVVQLRIDNLKAKETKDMDVFEKASLEREITQLESLIPEIQMKIEDMKEQIQSHCKTMMAIANETRREEEKTIELCKEKPITNISHLIKRKRRDRIFK
ncbi:hypothetical protein SSS_07775 [Sarcoptes scabiei]|nr:hypothetical protein SSS_07775 [Sarcoptes scabiei]